MFHLGVVLAPMQNHEPAYWDSSRLQWYGSGSAPFGSSAVKDTDKMTRVRRVIRRIEDLIFCVPPSWSVIAGINSWFPVPESFHASHTGVASPAMEKVCAVREPNLFPQSASQGCFSTHLHVQMGLRFRMYP